MGSTASVDKKVKDQKKSGKENERPVERGGKYQPQPKNKVNKDSERRSTRSTNVSVRSMALMNHARQENSYISQDALQANFLKKSMRVASKDPASINFAPGENPIKGQDKKERSIRDTKTGDTILEPVLEPVQEVPQEAPSLKAPVGIGQIGQQSGLGFFRNTFNLKINIQDDADWTQVDDDDEQEDLGVFDMKLIEIPQDVTSPVNVLPSLKNVPPPIKTDKSTNQLSKGTIFVDGIKIGIGSNGIIKQQDVEAEKANKVTAYSTKMPMRERLIVLCKLGQGASSIVYKALDLTDLKLVALKMIHVHEKDKRVQMIRELCGLFQLLRENSRRESSHYPNKNFRRPEKYIVDFYDAFSNLEDGIVSLMIEYMDGGSLQDIVDHGGCDDEPTLANIAIQGLKGLAFLHGCNQIHRDLKPGNFLISHRGEVKVADLGIMKQLTVPTGGKGPNPLLPKTNTFVGTATYMSPERIDGKEYTFPSDIWAFGLSLITIALGNLPVDTAGGYWTILHSIRDAPTPSIPADRFSPEFCDFIDQCMKRNPDERATCKQLLKHPFLNKVVAEDLTYNQNYDRGKNELLSIIFAILTHIKSLKAYFIEREKEEEEQDDMARNHRLFGNLIETSATDILHKVLFGDNAPPRRTAATTMNANGTTISPVDSVPPLQSKRMIRPRLMNLSKQLHLPYDKVVYEAKIYYEQLVKAEDEINSRHHNNGNNSIPSSSEGYEYKQNS